MQPQNSRGSAAIEAVLCPENVKLTASQANDLLTHSVIGWLNCPSATGAAGRSGQAMPLRIDRINWMPSPPLAPDDGPIDLAHLGRMTLGDPDLEREVLAMFSAQSAMLLGQIATLAADGRALAHTLKGSARAIGAFAVADAAGRVEDVLGSGADPSERLAALGNAVAEAREAIESMLRLS
jgi:HPt (histidine-containing phosphotransfer) domain-containing protein